MTSPISMSRKNVFAVSMFALIVLMLAAGGCTQPSSQPEETAPGPVSVIQNDVNHITISYPGSTDSVNLVELEATVTDSHGRSQTRSVGSKLATMPLKFGATISFTGTFGGNDRILVTGYFMDGSQKSVLDTTI